MSIWYKTRLCWTGTTLTASCWVKLQVEPVARNASFPSKFPVDLLLFEGPAFPGSLDGRVQRWSLCQVSSQRLFTPSLHKKASFCSFWEIPWCSCFCWDKWLELGHPVCIFLYAASENRFKNHVCKKDSCEIVSLSSCANGLLNGIAGTVTCVICIKSISTNPVVMGDYQKMSMVLIFRSQHLARLNL